jgi:hypothetical protein
MVSIHLYSIFEAPDRIAELRYIRGFGDWLDYLNLSASQAAQLIPEVTSSTPHQVSRSLIFDWKKSRRTIYPQQLRVMGDVLGQRLTSELQRDIHRIESRTFRVEITRGVTRWYVKVYTTCVKCSRWYHITREGSKRCKRCITRSKRKAAK